MFQSAGWELVSPVTQSSSSDLSRNILSLARKNVVTWLEFLYIVPGVIKELTELIYSLIY